MLLSLHFSKKDDSSKKWLICDTLSKSSINVAIYAHENIRAQNTQIFL